MAPVDAGRDGETAKSPVLYLVSCVKTKRRTRACARDLYVSPWFAKAREYVESSGCPWFILSAEYGLLHPDTEVEPYERTLNRMRVQERRAWARRVLDSLAPHVQGVHRIVVLAGARYREFLMPTLKSLCEDVRVPMAGLRSGEQLQWLGSDHGSTA